MAIRDAYALLVDPEMQDRIVSSMGQAAYDRIMKSFQVGTGIEQRVVGGTGGMQVVSQLTGAISQAYLTINPGTYVKVFAGGIARMISDLDISIAGLTKAVASLADPRTSLPDFEEIQKASGYFYARANQQSLDRRNNQQRTRLEDVRRSAAVGHLKAAFQNLATGQVNDARKQLQRAFGQIGLLDYLDRKLVQIAVQAHRNAGYTFESAVRRAELTIRRSQNTTSSLDDPAVLAGDSMRYILPFSSDPLKAGARLYQSVAVPGNRVEGTARWITSTLLNTGANLATPALLGAVAMMINDFIGDEEDELIAEAQNMLRSPFVSRPGRGKQVALDVAEELLASGGAASFLVGGLAMLITRTAMGEKAYSSDVLPMPLAYEAAEDMVQAIDRMINAKSEETREKYIANVLNTMAILTVGDPTGPARRLIFGANSYFGKYDPRKLTSVRTSLKKLIKDEPPSDDTRKIEDLIKRIDRALAARKPSEK